jgi:hypothetical protein
MKRRHVKLVKPNGLFALRNHEVEDAINKDEPLQLYHGDEEMTMDPHSLKTKQLGRSPWITDESGDFYIIDYRWEPNIVPND